MKVLFSLTYYSPYISGLTLYVKRLAEELVKKNHDVSVICMQHDRSLSLEENINEIRVLRGKPILKINKGFISFDFIVKAWQLVRSVDSVVVNLPQFEGLIVFLFAKLFNKKIITIYYCDLVLSKGLINLLIQNLLDLSSFLSLFFSDKVVTYNEDFSRNSRLLPVFIRKINYISPPIPIPLIDKNIQRKLKEKIGNSNYVIGLVARLAAEKGVEYLLEAIPQIKSKLKNSKFKIIIIGPLNPVGEENYKDKILNLVEKYKDNVALLGVLSDEEMGPFYSLLDVLVLPSINSTEAFGMVQVEAMFCGVPVVVSDLPGVRIPVQKTGMGIVVPIKNSQKIAEAIVEIITNKQKFIKSKGDIEKEFSLEQTIKSFEKLLS